MASTAKAAARPPHSKLTFGFGGYVAFGELGAFAEKELLHLFFHYFLRAGIEGLRRYSFITILECSIQSFQASFETLS